MISTSIIGNLTADPVLTEREYTDNSTGEILKAKVCNFTVAADHGFGTRKTTQFFRVKAWRGLGELCAKYLKKGKGVFVMGAVSLNNYTAKDNTVHYTMDILADQIQFLSDSRKIETPGEPETIVEEVEEDLPY